MFDVRVSHRLSSGNGTDAENGRAHQHQHPLPPGNAALARAAHERNRKAVVERGPQRPDRGRSLLVPPSEARGGGSRPRPQTAQVSRRPRLPRQPPSGALRRASEGTLNRESPTMNTPEFASPRPANAAASQSRFPPIDSGPSTKPRPFWAALNPGSTRPPSAASSLGPA